MNGNLIKSKAANFTAMVGTKNYFLIFILGIEEVNIRIDLLNCFGLTLRSSWWFSYYILHPVSEE